MPANAVIRPTTVADIDRIAAIRREVDPQFGPSVAAQRQHFLNLPETANRLALVAVAAGTVVAFGSASRNVFTDEVGAADLQLMVAPGHRRRGIGSALHRQLDEHLARLGTRRAQVWVNDNPDFIGWAGGRGYEPSRDLRFSTVDPAVLPPLPPIPPGVTLKTITEAGLQTVYEVDSEAFLDEPGDIPTTRIPLEQWAKQHWDVPDHQRDLGIVAYVDGVPAGYTIVEADLTTGRGWSGGTGVLREFRGQGLAKLIKSVSLRRAAAAGITEAYTTNDEANAPMLAVNEWLGYKITKTQWSCLKTF